MPWKEATELGIQQHFGMETVVENDRWRVVALYGEQGLGLMISS